MVLLLCLTYFRAVSQILISTIRVDLNLLYNTSEAKPVSWANFISLDFLLILFFQGLGMRPLFKFLSTCSCHVYLLGMCNYGIYYNPDFRFFSLLCLLTHRNQNIQFFFNRPGNERWRLTLWKFSSIFTVYSRTIEENPQNIWGSHITICISGSEKPSARLIDWG